MAVMLLRFPCLAPTLTDVSHFCFQLGVVVQVKHCSGFVMCGCTVRIAPRQPCGLLCVTRGLQTSIDDAASSLQVACATEITGKAPVSAVDPVTGWHLVPSPAPVVVDPQSVAPLVVGNVFHSNTFVDPLRGVTTTAIVANCMADSVSVASGSRDGGAASVPPPCASVPSTRAVEHHAGSYEWLSVQWQLSHDIVPQPSVRQDEP